MRLFRLFLISVLVGAFSCGAGIRVHRIDKLGESSATSPAFDHTAARAEATKVFPLLADKHGWDFSQSSDSEIFTNEGLRDIDVIIFDNNTGNLLNASEQRAFEKWVRAGGGVIGIHGATHAHKGVNEANVGEWPFWYGLWGVLHKTGPKDGPNGRRGYADEIVMHQAKDGIIGNLPSRWIFDKVEWYFWNYHDGFDDKHVVATAEVQANQPELPAHYPVTWCGQYKGGRVWYTNMGHYAENFHQPEFIQHIVDGINWVARGQVD